MTDNPRTILKDAGVECAEVEAYLDTGDVYMSPEDGLNHVVVVKPSVPIKADDAILALARMVAEREWELMVAITMLKDNPKAVRAHLDRRYAEHMKGTE